MEWVNSNYRLPIKSWCKDIDLSEAPQAYKDIDTVIESQSDLVELIIKLRPLGVIKG